jgi:hypothetical protein
MSGRNDALTLLGTTLLWSNERTRSFADLQLYAFDHVALLVASNRNSDADFRDGMAVFACHNLTAFLAMI